MESKRPISEKMNLKHYLSKGSTRSVNAKKNILLSFIIKGFNILIGLMLVPLTIHYISQAQYGIWLTLSSIIAWFSFFDIGFGNGLRNRLSEAIANQKYQLARIYISTTYAIISAIALVLLLLFLVINLYLDWPAILNTDKSFSKELTLSAAVIIFFFCFQFVFQLINVVLNANQEAAKAGLLNLIGNVITLVAIFFLLQFTSGRLLYLSIASGSSVLIVLIVGSLFLFSGKYRQLAPSFSLIRLKYVKRLMDLGLKFFVIQIAFIVLYQTGNIIITQVFGPEEVTLYNIVYRYFAVLPMIFTIVITPFWSAFTEAWVKRDISWIGVIMKKLKWVWLTLSIVCITMVLASGPIYKVWIGKDLQIPFSLSFAMGVYVVINLWNSIYSHFLNGVGKIKMQLLISTIGSIINVPLGILFCKYLGVYGVVLSTIIVSLLGAIFYPIQYQKIISGRDTGLWAQ